MNKMLIFFNVGLLVKPVVLYGAKVWGSERLQLRFFKYVLSVNKFTSSMVLYKLGATPIRFLFSFLLFFIKIKVQIFNIQYY